jgi:hypothetical protein
MNNLVPTTGPLPIWPQTQNGDFLKDPYNDSDYIWVLYNDHLPNGSKLAITSEN